MKILARMCNVSYPGFTKRGGLGRWGLRRFAWLSPLLLAVALSAGVSGMATASPLEKEIGVTLSDLNAKEAERLLNRYVEGKILTFAGKAPRVELLGAIVKAAKPGTVLHKRAELLLQSAKTSYRK